MGIARSGFWTATASVGVGLVLLVTGCGAGSDASQGSALAGEASPSDPPHSWVTEVPTALTGGSTSPDPAATVGLAAPTAVASADPLTGTIIPADFPFPPQAAVTVSDSKPTDATVNVGGVTAAAALAFYRQALPGAGYTFFQEGGSDGRTKLTYTGRNQSVEVLAGGARTPDLVLVIFTQCTSAVDGGGVSSRRSDRVACT